MTSLECDIYLKSEVDKMKDENRELWKRLEDCVRENAELNAKLCKLERSEA